MGGEDSIGQVTTAGVKGFGCRVTSNRYKRIQPGPGPVCFSQRPVAMWKLKDRQIAKETRYVSMYKGASAFEEGAKPVAALIFLLWVLFIFRYFQLFQGIGPIEAAVLWLRRTIFLRMVKNRCACQWLATVYRLCDRATALSCWGGRGRDILLNLYLSRKRPSFSLTGKPFD